MWGAAISSIIWGKNKTTEKNSCKPTFILKAFYLNKFIRETTHSEKSSKIAQWKQMSLPWLLLGLILILNWVHSDRVHAHSWKARWALWLFEEGRKCLEKEFLESSCVVYLVVRSILSFIVFLLKLWKIGGFCMVLFNNSPVL